MTLREAAVRGLAALTRRAHPPGTDRLLRILHHPDRRPWSIRTVVDARHGGRFHVDTARFIEWRLFFYGSYEGEVLETIRRYVTPGSQAIDVGANIGTHALVMAEAIGAGRVVACEPNPHEYSRLARNIRLNDLSTVSAVPVALGDRIGRAALRLPPLGDANGGTARLQAPGQGTRVPAALDTKAPTVMVDVETLDHLAQRLGLADVGFIKIDVEGFEGAVLAGAREVLRASRPTLLFEYHDRLWHEAGSRLADVLADLRRIGYRKFGFLAGDRRGYVELGRSSSVPPFANIVAVGRRDPSSPLVEA
jgi:FkbM family methyltransferase